MKKRVYEYDRQTMVYESGVYTRSKGWGRHNNPYCWRGQLHAVWNNGWDDEDTRISRGEEWE